MYEAKEAGSLKRDRDPGFSSPRYRQLKPGPGKPTRDVRANQRGRLMAAMVELVAERGYDRATVGELVKIAGVSKASFYEQFSGKEACFLETYDAALREAARSALVGERAASEGRERLRAALKSIGGLVCSEPKAAKLVLVDGLAASPTVRAHVARRFGLLEVLVRERLASAPDGIVLPHPITKGIVRGIAFAARRSILIGNPDQFMQFVDSLLDWVLAFNCTASRSAFSRLSDRRPRTSPSWHQERDRRSRPAGDREMMIAATVRLASAEGFAALSPSRIRTAAGVSRRTFDRTFSGVGECFLSSLEVALPPLFVEAARAGRGQGDWSRGVCATMRSLSGLFAESPGLARLAFVEMLAAAPVSLDWSQEKIAAWANFVYGDAPVDLRPPPAVAEASVAMIWGLMADQFRAGRIHVLPEMGDQLAFVALLPVVGPDTALDLVEQTRPPCPVVA
jgi:AcrR family transcriptional regulator